MKYKLINPVIEGGFDTIYSAKSPIKAANKCWLQLSSLLSNSVPSFAFTMKDMSGGSGSTLHHYKVHEKKNAKNKKISYEISELSLTLTDNQRKRLEGLEDETKNKRGGLGEVDSEENEEDQDEADLVGGSCPKYGYWDNSSVYHCDKYKSYAITPLMPINTWSYWPMVYTWNIAFYIPQFIAPLSPYIAIYT